MKSYFSVLCVLILALALSFACKEEIKVYRVGAVISLSGAADAYGRNVKNGMMLALDQINSKGGIKGKQMDILFEDDQTTEKVAVEKFNQLAGNGVPVIIGGVTSNLALAMAPVGNEKKVVFISPTATSPKLTGISPYFFRNFPSDTLEGRVMAEYAVRKMKLRSIAILYVDKEYGQGITNVFKNRFQELGGSVTFERAYPEGTTDFVSYIKELNTAPPDGIYLPGYFPEIAAILKEIQAQKVTARVLSVQGMATPVFLEIAGDAAEGVVYPQPPYDPESGEADIKDFVSAYKAKYPIKPDVDAAFAYDAVMLVAKAIEKCDEFPKDLRAKIADTNIHGITGDIAFDSGGDVDIQPRMFEIRGGQFVPIR